MLQYGKRGGRQRKQWAVSKQIGKLGKEDVMADQTGKSKTYSYDYEDYENGKKAETMLQENMADPEFP